MLPLILLLEKVWQYWAGFLYCSHLVTLVIFWYWIFLFFYLYFLYNIVTNIWDVSLEANSVMDRSINDYME